MRRFTDGLRASGLRCLSCRASGAVAAAVLCMTVALPAHADEPHVGNHRGLAEGTAFRTGSFPALLGTAGTGSTAGISTVPPSSDGDENVDRGRATAGGAGTRPSGSLTVIPSVVSPGAEVEIRVEGCRRDKNAKTTVRSDAFVQEARPAPDGGGSLIAETKIRSTARPGRYRITDDCGVVGSVTVVGPSATPTAPVRAGGGGTALVTGSAKAAGEHGPGLAHVLVGASLAGGAGLAVAGGTVRRRKVNSAGEQAGE